jgi:hypothetical protein
VHRIAIRCDKLRRRIACLEAQDNATVRLHQGFVTGGMGFRNHFAQQ